MISVDRDLVICTHKKIKSSIKYIKILLLKEKLFTSSTLTKMIEMI